MADDVSYNSLSVARKGLNQSGEWNVVGTDIYVGMSMDLSVFHRQTDWDSFMTSLMNPPRYHLQFIPDDTVNIIFTCSVITTFVDTKLSLELTEYQSVFL